MNSLRGGKRAALRTGGGHTIASAEQTAVRWVRPRVARARDEVGNAERGGDAMMNVHVSPPRRPRTTTTGLSPRVSVALVREEGRRSGRP